MMIFLVLVVGAFVDADINCTKIALDPCISSNACQCHCFDIATKRQLCSGGPDACSQFKFTSKKEIVRGAYRQYGLRQCECGWPDFGSYTGCSVSLDEQHKKMAEQDAWFAGIMSIFGGFAVLCMVFAMIEDSKRVYGSSAPATSIEHEAPASEIEHEDEGIE